MVFRLCLAVCGVAVCVVSGCGSGERPAITGTVPFTGTVKLDGKPLAGASLMFVPLTATGAELDAGAMTDESGKFEAMSDTGRAAGVFPGEYKVVISRLVKPDGSVVVPTSDKSPMQLIVEEQAKESVHPRYSDLLRTGLRASIPSGGGSQDFELVSS